MRRILDGTRTANVEYPRPPVAAARVNHRTATMRRMLPYLLTFATLSTAVAQEPAPELLPDPGPRPIQANRTVFL